MTHLAHIADRVLNRPMLITSAKLATIATVLSERIGIDPPDASRFEGDHFALDENGERRFRPYRAKDGVAIISIVGSLVNRGAYIGASSGVVSYEGIQFQIKKAVEAGDIHSIILDIQSPGGEAVGAFETAEMVRDAAKTKKVIAVVNGMAASAAYAIASGATEIVTTQTGVSGSIGVVILHTDHSGLLKQMGIKATLIYAGENKVDGNPFGPLSKEVLQDLQAEVDTFYDAFCETVALGRGARLSAGGARATNARTFIGVAAVERGLADSVGSFQSVLDALSRASATSVRRFSPNGGLSMSEQPGTPTADTNAGISQAALDQAVATATQEGNAAGSAAATERLSAVLGTDGIKGDPARMSAALDLAVSSPGMSAEQVAGFVSANVQPSASQPSEETTAAALENDRQPVALALPKTGADKPKGNINTRDVYAARRKMAQGA